MFWRPCCKFWWEKGRGKKVSTWIRSSFMCHFHLVSFVAVTKLFLLIPSGSQAQLWWKLQSFTWRIIGIAPIECSAGKGTVQSSMEHQWLQAAGYCCSTGNRGGNWNIPFSKMGVHYRMEELAYSASEECSSVTTTPVLWIPQWLRTMGLVLFVPLY